jgi:hypothetical protein
MMFQYIVLGLITLGVTTPAMGRDAAAARESRRGQVQGGLTADQAADRQVWIDEHARWNAQHMVAARRLEAVVAALKQHNTGFDIRGRELREHGTAAATVSATAMHPRLRTAHEQARNVHDDLMDAVDMLSRVLRKNLGQNQSFPEAAQEDGED